MGAAKGSGVPRATSTTFAGVAAGAIGTHAALWLTIPSLAGIITILEAALAMLVFLTALFAPQKYSDRAFRMLVFTAHQSVDENVPPNSKKDKCGQAAGPQ
jgi:hypothetical protein